MPMVVVVLLAVALLAWTTAAAPAEAAAAYRVPKPAPKGLQVKHPFCQYTVKKTSHKLLGSFGQRKKRLRLFEVTCDSPGQFFTVGGIDWQCKQIRYKAKYGKDHDFNVNVGCVASMVSVGLPALVVRPETESNLMDTASQS